MHFIESVSNCTCKIKTINHLFGDWWLCIWNLHRSLEMLLIPVLVLQKTWQLHHSIFTFLNLYNDAYCIENTQIRFQEHIWCKRSFIIKRIFHKSNKIVTKPSLNFFCKQRPIYLLYTFPLKNGTFINTMIYCSE